MTVSKNISTGHFYRTYFNKNKNHQVVHMNRNNLFLIPFPLLAKWNFLNSITGMSKELTVTSGSVTNYLENPYIKMTKARFYEPARLSTPPKPLFSLKPLDANLVEVIVI